MVITGAPRVDRLYVKPILKGEIKVTKLNSDNYQSWADGMELLLDAKMLWPVVSGSEPSYRDIDNSDSAPCLTYRDSAFLIARG